MRIAIGFSIQNSMEVSLVASYHFCTLGTCKLPISAVDVSLTYASNHAANAHMLHALGITHVVSVGEFDVFVEVVPK